MSVRPTPIHYKYSRAGLSLHTTAADGWPDPTHTHTHTHTQRRTLTHSRVTHTRHSTHSQRRWSSDQLWEMLPAGSHWVSPLSLPCARLSLLCLSLLWWPFCGPVRVHLSLPLSSVAVKWPVFSQTERLFKLFSQYAVHIPFSPLPAFLSFLCKWTETEANPGPICMLAQSQAWMPLYLNNRAERMDVDLLYSQSVLLWFLFPEVCVCVVIACD